MIDAGSEKKYWSIQINVGENKHLEAGGIARALRIREVSNVHKIALHWVDSIKSGRKEALRMKVAWRIAQSIRAEYRNHRSGILPLREIGQTEKSLCLDEHSAHAGFFQARIQQRQAKKSIGRFK